MKYYKAFEIVEKPFITWDLVATNENQLSPAQLDDPLIMAADEIPANQYGVCPLKIVAGELVNRTAPEMAAFEAEFDTILAFQNNQKSIADVNAGTFVYATKTFPMDEVSRLFYQSVEKVRGNTKLMTVEGVLYSLIDTATNIDDFMAAYYEKLNELTQPNV